MHEHYRGYISGNELLTVPSALEAVTTRTSALLTTEGVKSRKLVDVSRKTVEEAIKSLNIGARILAKRSNVTATEEDAKKLAGSILTTKVVRMHEHTKKHTHGHFRGPFG